MPRRSRRLPGGRARRTTGPKSRRGQRAAASTTDAPAARRQSTPAAERPARRRRTPARSDRQVQPSASRRAAGSGRLAPLDVAAANLTYIRADLTRIGIISGGLLTVLIVLTVVLR